MKKVSIIIPYHSETYAQIRRAFASVTMQVGVSFNDIEVLLVGDGVAPLPNALFPSPKDLLVRQLNYEPSRGAGVARQAGIDHTTGRYIMFIDADDELIDVFALKHLMAPISVQDYDLVVARYTKQQRGRQGFNYVLSAKRDWKAAYGKLYQRDYLTRVGLRWHPDLRIFEDTYFVGSACELAQNIYYLDQSVYVWLWNPNSTVRKNGHSFDHQLHVWARSNRYSLAVLRQKKPSVWPRDFYRYMADLYYRQNQHTPADPVKFAEEQTALLVENRTLWTNEGEQQIRDLVARFRQPGESYAGQSADGLDEYMKDQDHLLREAFLREVQND
ncbi:glycosyltransferase family 2 protein [Lacticaseibacillus camelliae]|uniref:Glycosyltransferase 2-like domain-containing protein n=1 Tax=Lacticaseibacillus camelliae DSM 22697 = JCM 13995 TaxID=1423730 RepID=A0A0R2FA01_9LACO|nr:glycosyltransferase family A protein [Lacticaseibacillus camelliae]KRN25185.1 hypothetical protein FC75_GL000937 [Lacticaseibacillus camelliae DSM 22697 = JCM 13995]